MDHGYIDEHNLVERYVLGQLDDVEQERFEDHYADCARCYEAVELSQELRAGLVAHDAEATAEAVVVPMRPRAAPSPRRTLPGWAIAALLALALLPSFWLARQNRNLSAEVERLGSPWTATPTVVLEPLRDSTRSDAVPTITASEQPWIPVAIELGDVAGLGIDVELHGDDGTLLWTGQDLRAPNFGPLILSFPRSLLPPGRYRFVVHLKAAGRVEPAGDFAFTVVP